MEYLRGEGCGNTFILFDCLDGIEDDLLESAHLSLLKEQRDDALILTKEMEDERKLVVRMVVLEPDRSLAAFCGNGARVVARYLQMRFGNRYEEYVLMTSLGERKVWWEDNAYHVDMGTTELRFSSSSFLHPRFMKLPLGLGVRKFNFFWTETMEPHLVTFDHILEEELHLIGLHVNRQRTFFPWGVNLNKAEVLPGNSLRVVTFERGVNRVTQACGTGATSSAMLAIACGKLKDQEVTVFLKGGTLYIYPKGERAIMSGPAQIED